MLLLIEIERFCRRTGIPVTKFGRLAVNDPRLVGDMRRGRQVGARNEARVRSTMQELRP